MKYCPLVSIVTPSYNQGEFLEETINSILDQTYKNIEYYIIDGGSLDNSISIIKKYEKYLNGWVSEKDEGQSNAINKGYKLTSGEIFTWINSDDLLKSDAVESVIPYFTNQDVVLINGDAEVIDKESKHIGFSNGNSIDYKSLLKNLQYGIIQPSTFIRSGIFSQVGLLNESLHYAMDYDLFIRLADKGKFVYKNQIFSCVRMHGNAKTISLPEKHYKEVFVVLSKYTSKKPIKPVLRYYKFKLFSFLPNRIKEKIMQLRASPRDLYRLKNY